MTLTAAPQCLTRPYADKPSQKGGTVIREDVLDLETHRRLLATPDGYRPRACPRCGHHAMHVHSLRTRLLGNRRQGRAEDFRRYQCPRCTGVWSVLAGFVACCLNRAWTTIQDAMVGHGVLKGRGSEQRTDVPLRTRQRWAARLRACAAVLVQLLVGSQAVGEAVVAGRGGSRAHLIEDLTDAGLLAAPHRVGALAVWLHRLVPGVRLM